MPCLLHLDEHLEVLAIWIELLQSSTEQVLLPMDLLDAGYVLMAKVSNLKDFLH